MACAHSNPPDIMARAEAWLRERGISADRWNGMKFRHAENTPGNPWSSVVIDIERRETEWIVTRIDRRPEPVPPGDVGLRVV
jgi:hypothetical protein